MARLLSFSEYVDKIISKLQSSGRAEQNLILVREIADLRMQVAAIANSVSALASYQEIAEALHADESDAVHPKLPGHVHIDASQHLQLLEGFYALEYTEAGMAYRWTGPSRRFRFAVWIDRTVPVDVRLQVLFPGNPANVMNSRLLVGNIEFMLTYNDLQNVFAAEGIPPRSFHGVTIFEFELAALVEDKDPNDQRELGIPFCAFVATARPTDTARLAHG